MTVPNDVVRFEILLYLSLLVDALTAAFFGIGGETASGPASAQLQLFTALFLAALVLLVWLAARRRKNWARWTLFVIFALSVLLYAAAFPEMAFGVRILVDLLSIALMAAGFYFAFTPEARRWFA